MKCYRKLYSIHSSPNRQTDNLLIFLETIQMNMFGTCPYPPFTNKLTHVHSWHTHSNRSRVAIISNISEEIGLED